VNNKAYALLLSVLAFASVVHAGDITVYEDKYGVPSIVASDIKSATFALGYVQAKDHAQRMALNYKLARGRSSEATGKSSLLQDGFLRGLGFEAKAQELAPKLSNDAKVIVESFVAGTNKALSEQRATLPKWVEPFTVIDVLSLTQFVNAAFPLLDLSQRISPGAGSNQFALAPSRTSTKHPIVSIDPHLGWDGQDGGIIWQEFAVYTPEVSFRGVAIPGLPIGVLGHNDRVAWSMTNNDPSLYTLYTVKVNPNNHSQYSYHGKWKEFTYKTEQMRYLDGGILKANTTTLKLTEWGPMIPFSNRAARFSVPDPETTFRQGMQMIQAKSVGDFRDALKLHGLSMWNFVYGDTDGNIGYQYNADVPQRDESINWAGIVAGDDPKTEWGPPLSIDELPHAENPASGILVNCNSSPFLTTLGSEIKKEWPAYVTTYGPTTRWEMLSALLTNAKRVSPAKAMELATDCTVPYAAATVDRLSKLVDVGNAIDILKRWDKKATIDSVGCVLYTYWLRENKGNVALSAAASRGADWTPEQIAIARESLNSAAKKTITEQGSLSVRWGDVQYMQRGTVKSPVQGFGYVEPGTSLAAVSPASAGSDTLKGGRSHATFGSSFRMIVSLDPKGIQSWSVLPYGNSNVPTSPHYSDQMPLYAVGKYKPTNFGRSNVKKNSVRNYTLSY